LSNGSAVLTLAEEVRERIAVDDEHEKRFDARIRQLGGAVMELAATIGER